MTKLQSLAAKFRVKLAQFSAGLTDEENAAILKSINQPNVPYESEYGKRWKAWKKEHPNASEEEIETASSALNNELNAKDPEYIAFQEWGKRKGKSSITEGDIREYENESDKINKQQAEFDKQDKEIETFKAKEQEDKERQQKSIDGKTPFMQADAQNIMRSFIPKMKNIKGNFIFIFYNNGNVGITSQDIKSANIIRTKFALEISLALKQYILYNKKYFKTSSITIQIVL